MAEQTRQFPRGFGAGCIAILAVNFVFGVFLVQPLLRELTGHGQAVVMVLFVTGFMLMMAVWMSTMKLLQTRRDSAALQDEFDGFKQMYARALPIQLILALREVVNAAYASGAWLKLEWPTINPVHSTTHYIALIESLIAKHGAQRIIRQAELGLLPFELPNITVHQRAFIAKLLQKAVMPPSS